MLCRAAGLDSAVWLTRFCRVVWVAILLVGSAFRGQAAVLWSDFGATLVHETGPGTDILGGAVKRDDTSSDTLYFKFHVDPLSDATTEEYFAAFQLFEGDEGRLAVGNSLKAWAYSAFNTSETGESNNIFGDFDFHSSHPELSGLGTFFNYELPRRGIERTIVLRVQYVPGGDDKVTVWLNPDLAIGATEENQTNTLTTRFKANACFNEIRLRHGGGGGGWTFSDMAIATSFSDFIAGRNMEMSEAMRIGFQTWKREQGLPQNSVRALAQTRDGYLWIGNDDGLARFDGVRFVSFGTREGLWSGPVSELFEDNRGALWIGTVGGGLSRWRDGKFTTYTIRDGLPSDTITALSADNDGRLWIGTEAGLALLEQDRLSALAAGDLFKGKAIATLFRDRRGTMWLGAKGVGVFHFLAGKFMPVTDLSVDELLKDPHCVLVDQSVRTWIGAGDDFVLCHDGDQWRRYRIPRHLARPYVSALAEEPDGTVWAGSVNEGLFQFKAGKVTTFNANSGLADNFVESLLVDRDGVLWIGTGGGLNRVRRGNISAIGQNEGLGYGAVQGLAEISPGVVWAGKPSDGLYKWQNRSFSRFNPELSRLHPEINAVLLARDGSCWVACAQGLLQFRKPATDPDAIEQPPLKDANVISLMEDRDRVIWAGTREGQLWNRRNGTWTLRSDFNQPHAITALMPDADGGIWIGTEGGGLYRFQDGVREHFNKGKPRELLSNLIRTLYSDAKGTLWIGTAGGGLSRWAFGRMATFTTGEGLPDNTISQILEDDSGRLWLGSNRGIASVQKQDFDDVASGKGRAVYPRLYGRAEGMQSEECTGGFCPAGLRDKSRLLWFSTLKGVVVVNPAKDTAEAVAPTVLLEEVLVDGVLKQANQAIGFRGTTTPGLEIPPGKHRLELHYTGPGFDAPERLRFRYQMERLDPDWIDAGIGRSAVYNYVPPGDYRFRVSVSAGAGAWNATEAEMSLRVLPYFWQTWWFTSLSALACISLIGGTFRYLGKRKLERQLAQLEQERALERERSRIARDLHDDLGSSLARISLLSGLVKADKDNPTQVETYAGKIFDSADQTVRSLEEIVWAVRPGSDTLQSLVEYIAHFANELFEGNHTRCRLDLPHDLPPLPLAPDVRHNIFLIVKEALTNALKHSDAHEVRVQTKASESAIEIAVEDDGKGFIPSGTPSSDKRNGLMNMTQRAESIGGHLDLSSVPGRGTTVRFNLNLRNGETMRLRY
jgi:ligand-binding sensor domain-containing protein/signal transduction histidine kinase